jgi:thioredoxin-like negative regulator of GroEL
MKVVRGCRVALSAGIVLCLLLLFACGKATAACQNPKLAKALADANAAGKVVFVDFGAEWCEPCKRLASTMLTDATVVAWLREHAIPLTIDIDESQDLARDFHVQSVPTMLFLRPDGMELGRITGFVDAGACEPKVVKGKFTMMQGLAKRKDSQSPGASRSMLRYAAEEAVPAFEALVGVGRTEDALEIAATALTNAEDEVRSLFVSAAQRAGHGELADRLRAPR